MHASLYVCTDGCMYVCVYMYVCVCMYVFVGAIRLTPTYRWYGIHPPFKNSRKGQRADVGLLSIATSRDPHGPLEAGRLAPSL